MRAESLGEAILAAVVAILAFLAWAVALSLWVP
jgi:hypothetical protein